MKIITTTSILQLRPDGIIDYAPREDYDKLETVETMAEIVDAINTLSQGKKRAILCHMKNQYLGKEVLDSTKGKVEFLGMALLTNSFGTKILGNFIVKFLKDDMLFKLFMKREEAEKWLADLVEANEKKLNATTTS